MPTNPGLAASDAASGDISPEIDRLRHLIDTSGLIRKQVAKHANMTEGDLSRMLSGRHPRISLMLVKRVLIAINCGWGDLDIDLMHDCNQD